MRDPAEIGSFGRLLTSSIPKSQPAVSRLHHYTSFDAAKEILRNHTLHLTHAAFSNDPTELSYGLTLMENMFGKAGKEAFSNHDFLSILYYNTQPYIFCLSESEDMLSQWDMYSGRNGCCITFSNEITTLTHGDRVALGPVIYEKEKQLQYLEFLSNARQTPAYREQDRLSTNLYFILSVIFLKSSAFSQEKEWRIVQIVQEESFDTIEYRSGSRFLKPYVKIQFQPLPITEIKIGPADDQDRLIRSMEHLIKMTKGYENVTVSRSSISLSPS
jgi:hypothetical protein